MIGKRGNLAVSKIIKIALAVVVLFVVFQGTAFGFDSAFNRVEGMYNDVLALFHIGGGGNGGECLRSFNVDITDGVNGGLVVCKTNCTFNLTSPEELLGANKFAIVNGKLKAQLVGGMNWVIVDGSQVDNGGWISPVSWGNDPEKSKEQREAFKELQKVYAEFFKKFGDDKSEKEFFAPREFDPNGVLEFTLKRSWVTRWLGDIIFSWNGEEWRKVVREKESPIGAVKVFDIIYKNYQEGGHVSWHYRGDGKKYPFTSGDSESEFIKQFNEIKDGWDSKSEGQKVFLTNLKEFLRRTSFKFRGEPVEVKIGWKNYDDLRDKTHRILVIYFEQNGERFGLYYNQWGPYSKPNDYGSILMNPVNVGDPSLAYGYDDKFELSPISDKLRLSDEDWDNFIKVNEIYDFLKMRGCGE